MDKVLSKLVCLIDVSKFKHAILTLITVKQTNIGHDAFFDILKAKSNLTSIRFSECW